MTTTAPRSLRDRTRTSRARARRDRMTALLLRTSVGVAIVPLTAILLVTFVQGQQAFGWEFLTDVAPFNPTEAGGGYLHGFVGTLYMVALAVGMSVPLGILAAVYLAEFRSGPLVRPIRFFTDVMTGVPSIFVGVFVYSAFVVDFDLFYGTLPGAVALAVLMLPIVVRSSEEILRLVPDELRSGAAALGARRWQSVVRIVLPTAAPGLVTGSMLAVARAIGETAPLIFTALGANRVILELSGTPQTSLTLLAFDEARTFADAANQRGWAGAFSLIMITLLLTVLARLISRRSAIHTP